VTVDYAIDLRLVADVTNASVQEIVALNPSLLRMATPRDMPFDLHLPVGTQPTFESRIKSIPEDKRASWRFHMVRDGESLDGIASALHVKPSEIVTVNGLEAGAGIDAGDELVIPVASATNGVHPQHYTLRRGDTLVTVADRFDISVDELRRWNHLSSSTVPAGRLLNVAEPVKLAPTTHVHSRHARTASKGADPKTSGTKTSGTKTSVTKTSGTKTGSGSSGKKSATKAVVSTKKTQAK
jgi:membrane-bound lytic murein transglycosylase D